MLIIEDGTGKADATSYVTVAELAAYAAERNETIPADEAGREALLRNAMDYLEAQSYEGTRATEAQALEWPRAGVTLFQWYVDHDVIPTRLKNAQLQLALEARETQLMATQAPSALGAVVEKRVEGAVSVKYAEPQASMGLRAGSVGVTAAGAYMPRVAALLRPLLRGTGAVTVRRG